MTRGELKREVAHAGAILDPAVDLLKARFPSLIRDAIEREFSPEGPITVVVGDVNALAFQSRALQETAKGILSAARERATLLVAQAVAERLAAGDGEKWLAATREREARAQREFDEYKLNCQRETRERQERRALLKRIRSGSIADSPAATRERSISLERAALRARINALSLPRIQ